MSDDRQIRDLATVDPVAEKIVRVLDGLFRIPGTNVRFGIDPILGLVVPGLGDAASGMFGFYVVFAGLRRGVPIPVLFQMLGNLALDAMLGAIPFVGDLFDFAFKANDRNLALLKRHAGGEPAGALAWVAVAAAVAGVGAMVLAPLVLVLWGFSSCGE